MGDYCVGGGFVTGVQAGLMKFGYRIKPSNRVGRLRLTQATAVHYL